MPRKKQFLDSLSGPEALAVLRALARSDRTLRRRIETEAKEILRKVDVDELASAVVLDLEHLEVEDLWDRSGSTRYGYVDPVDEADEMVVEALAPYLEELRRHRELDLIAEAELGYMGLLRGLHDYDLGGTGAFKDWATDVPVEHFRSLLDEWIRYPARLTRLPAMRSFLDERCPEYALWAGRLVDRAADGDDADGDDAEDDDAEDDDDAEGDVGAA